MSCVCIVRLINVANATILQAQEQHEMVAAGVLLMRGHHQACVVVST
jgi:hypothetical protein